MFRDSVMWSPAPQGEWQSLGWDSPLEISSDPSSQDQEALQPHKAHEEVCHGLTRGSSFSFEEKPQGGTERKKANPGSPSAWLLLGPPGTLALGVTEPTGLYSCSVLVSRSTWGSQSGQGALGLLQACSSEHSGVAGHVHGQSGLTHSQMR